MAVQIESQSRSERGGWHGDVLVASVGAAPRLRATRRALGMALAAYVIALQTIVAWGGGSWHWPIHPHVEWAAPIDVLGLALLQTAPVGYFLAFGLRRARTIALATVLGAAAVGLHVILGLWGPARVHVSTTVAGGLGAGFGAAVFLAVAARSRRRARNDAIVIAPDLPLVGGVYLLTPLLWLTAARAASDPTPGHAWPLMLVGLYGASLLASAYASRGPAGGGSLTHAAIAASWFTAGSAPIVVVAPQTAAWCVAGVGVFAALHRPALGMSARERRIEAPAVRRALPLFATFLAIFAIAPLAHALAGRMDSSLLWAALAADAVPGRGVDYAAAAVALGYAAAELRGRDEIAAEWSWRVVGPWVVAIVAILAGARAIPEAGLPVRCAWTFVQTLLIGTAAARLGITLYSLQRSHARAHGSAARGVRTRRPADVRESRVTQSAAHVRHAEIGHGSVVEG